MCGELGGNLEVLITDILYYVVMVSVIFSSASTLPLNLIGFEKDLEIYNINRGGGGGGVVRKL